MHRIGFCPRSLWASIQTWCSAEFKPSALPKSISALQSNWFLHAWNTTLDLFKAVASRHNWAAPVTTVCWAERKPWWPSQHSPTTAALHLSSCTRTARASRKLPVPKGNLLWNRQQVHSSVYSSCMCGLKSCAAVKNNSKDLWNELYRRVQQKLLIEIEPVMMLGLLI